MNFSLQKKMYVTITALGLAVLPAAKAGCGDVGWTSGAANSPALTSSSSTMVYSHRMTDPPESNEGDQHAGASIVGLWHFRFLAQNSAPIPDGTLVDAGLIVWHSDGTEFTNSGQRKPATQNYCLGVWKKTGDSSYKAYHEALSYDDSGNPNGTAIIREDVTVDPGGDTFSGTFTIDVLDPAGNQVAHIAGRVTATRITVN